MRQPDRAMARRTAACQHVYPEESLAIALVRRSRPCTGGLRQSALSDVKCAGDRHQAFTLPWLSLPRGPSERRSTAMAQMQPRGGQLKTAWASAVCERRANVVAN